MKYLFHRSLVILFPVLFLLSDSQAQRPADLDSILSSISTRSQGAGFSVCVVRNDSVLYTKAFGYRDLARQLPVTTHTVFPVGSCTKAFTAAIIGRLVREKKLGLDVPANKYLPQLKFNTTQMTEQVTVRDLLCHRTGLPRHEFSWFLLASFSRDSMLKRIAFLEPNYRVAEKWQYSNFGYFVLGMLQQNITGNTYEQAIEQYFLQPLEMKRSYFSYELLLKDEDAALGYKKINDVVKQVPYHPLLAMAPAGGLNSTARDMARWLSGWITESDIIPQDFKKQAISSQIVTKAALPSTEAGTYFSNYGFGWFLTSYRGHYRAEHGGNIDGFTSTACFFPSDSIGIVVLCNRENSLVPAIIRNTLANHFLQLPTERTDEKKSPAPADNKPVVKSTIHTPNIPPTHPLLSYTGVYEHPGYGRITVSLRGDSLFTQLGVYQWWLQPKQYDTFTGIDLSDDIKMPAQFHTNADGYIESLSIPFESTVSPIRFLKQPANTTFKAESIN
jgi:CubicO group peptidase (beta-lactamase class C family)